RRGRAVRRRSRPLAGGPAPHQVASGAATVVAPRRQPRAPAPGAIRVLRQRKAGRLPRPLGLRADQSPLLHLPLRCRPAERAAQVPPPWVEARLEPHKGVDTVLRALPAILEREPDVRYAVAGAGSERDQLEKLAAKMGVGERVRFLGEVSERDLPALYSLAAVYVGASRRTERIGVEGFGISLVEASACGLPVVAGNAGGVPDAVRDGETGFLVPPEDPAAFA